MTMYQLVRFAAIVAAVGVSVACSPLKAASITLTPEADTTLFETFPNNNMGAVPEMAAGTTANGFGSRALLRFNVAGSIPNNAVITSASLSLRVVKVPLGGGANSTFALHRMLVAWNEGTKSTLKNGSTGTTGETTWNARMVPLTFWASPGAQSGTEFSAGASGSQFIAGVADYTFASTTNMVGDVQRWLTNSAGNFGWILLTQSEATDGTARRFASRENMTSNFRPRLQIQYSIPLEPAVLTNTTVVAGKFQFEFQAQAGRSYVVEGRPVLGTGPWTTVTNVPVQGAAGTVIISDTLTSSNRFYRVETQ